VSLFPETSAAARRYDRKMARWRSIVDWAKHRPWALKLIEPLSRGRGRFRFVDRWMDRATPAAARPDLSPWSQDTLAATWLGHATVLLRVGTTTILTDPVFSSRVGLGWGFGTLGPARFTRPALTLRELPPIDVVLLSHAHFDHLDRPTLAKLARRSTTVMCASNVRDLVNDLGFGEVIELDVGKSFVRGTGFRPVIRNRDESQTRVENPCHEMRITALPVRHWGARIVLDEHRGHCAFLIESPDARILYGGDSAHHTDWRPIGQQGGVDLAILGIGAYDPWIGGHANPEQAWSMAMDAGARCVLPMHHSTFKLSVEPRDDPLRRLLISAGDRAGDVVCRQIGETWRRN
jgi:L-ascorbate metabolism protein UlaG (beta-lactamase superfamily)